MPKFGLWNCTEQIILESICLKRMRSTLWGWCIIIETLLSLRMFSNGLISLRTLCWITSYIHYSIIQLSWWKRQTIAWMIIFVTRVCTLTIEASSSTWIRALKCFFFSSRWTFFTATWSPAKFCWKMEKLKFRVSEFLKLANQISWLNRGWNREVRSGPSTTCLLSWWIWRFSPMARSITHTTRNRMFIHSGSHFFNLCYI